MRVSFFVIFIPFFVIEVKQTKQQLFRAHAVSSTYHKFCQLSAFLERVRNRQNFLLRWEGERKKRVANGIIKVNTQPRNKGANSRCFASNPLANNPSFIPANEAPETEAKSCLNPVSVREKSSPLKTEPTSFLTGPEVTNLQIGFRGGFPAHPAHPAAFRTSAGN